jgi:CubicO group peptidase (beta-lactamase class C family)
VTAASERAAYEYAERQGLHAFVVTRGGSLVCARYGDGYTGAKPHALYSGTKSFWGVLGVAAQEDGLLSLDEPVTETIPEWRAEDWKSRVTLRQLLNLTSGFGFGGLGTSVPPYDRALAMDLRNEPGTKFAYGGIPLQVFGAVLQRKLSAQGSTPHEYLRERLLDPIGVRIGSWRELKDGTAPLPTGAFVAARDWLKYGQMLAAGGAYDGKRVVREESLAACFSGSAANPRYGLGFWLYRSADGTAVYYASGAGGQAMYVIPGRDTVVVRFGESSSYKHEAFLARLLANAQAPSVRG